MTLRLYDTMTREKRDFVPTDPGRVTMYVCGPTVYGYAHIGNFRPVVVFDTLYRVLRHVFGEGAVVYARNVTDVDDKINAKAADEGVPIKTITDRYLAAYEEDAAALKAMPPTLTPHATDHIQAMQDQIAALIARGCAYAAEGHALFDTQSFPDYGQLSGRPLDEMIAGARVEVAPYKRHPADFVLWKPSKPGEPVWDSPWGPGRPGWHIECSAMIEAQLGLPIDIHGGGIDLTFPHHENELAQGRCAHGLPTYARFWLHNGFLDIEGVKMSKSLGNVVIPHELLQKAPGEVIRWGLLAGHYRQPLDWTETGIEQARKALDRLYRVLGDADAALAGAAIPAADKAALAGVEAALLDDLNTPGAMAELFALGDALRAAIGTKDKAQIAAARANLAAAGALFGFLTDDPQAWFQGGDDELKAKVEGLLAARIEARKAKDWATADRIRDELTALNVEVMDGAGGATWRLKGAD